MAVALLSGSCSKDIPEETTPSEGNRVVFTLGGATRAAGDNDTYYSLAATDEEKQIDELLAVVFTEDGAYYKTFDANYDAGQKTASFDLGKNGTYDVYFVANADETLSGSLRTLTDQNSDSQVTAEDLSALLVTQEVGKKDAQDAWYPFLMFSDNAKRIVSTHGSITDGGLITMRRLAVRFDLVNAAEGVTINSVKLINRAKQSRLGASNDMSFSTPGDLYEEKLYDGLNLTGSFDTPTEYTATIYSYENVDITEDGAYLPALEIKYTMDDLQFTHTVKFFDSTDETGKTPLALKRNYLYRIVLTKPLDVAFNVVVDDWNTAEAFQINDLPFDTHDQAALNAQLKVNMFTEYNAKEFSLSVKTITSFYDKEVVSLAECPVASYVTWEELRDNSDALTAEFTGPDGQKYRIPTAGELNLLAPMYTLLDNRATINKEHDGVYHPFWNDNVSTNTYPNVVVTTPFQETIYLTNGVDHKLDQSHADDPDNDSEYVLKGESQMQVGAQTDQITYPLDPGTDVYNYHPVYAIRFKGTSQYAAYRWESCRLNSDNAIERYLSIKIKALPQDSKLTVDDITDNASFWADGYIEFKLPGSGCYESEVVPSQQEDNRFRVGPYGYCWSSTLADDESAYKLYVFMNGTDVSASELSVRLPLRFVKVSEQ